jgi:hypothetical protein
MSDVSMSETSRSEASRSEANRGVTSNIGSTKVDEKSSRIQIIIQSERIHLKHAAR